MNDVSETWLLDNLREAMSLGRNGPGELFTAPHGIRLLKAISEISYFGLYGSFNVSSAFLQSLKELLAPILGSSSFFSLMRFNTDYAPLFLSLCDVGFRFQILDHSSERRVQKLCKIIFETGPERVPFRYLDMLYGLNNLGFEVSAELREKVLSWGCLSSLGRLRNVGPSDAYALTHNIFYLTDFGRNPDELEDAVLHEVAPVLKRLSYNAVLQNDMDLLSEYVLCFGYLQSVDEEVLEFSNELQSRKQPEGYWLGPIDMKSSLNELKVSPTLHAFYSHYHTTLLAWQATKVNAEPRRAETRCRLLDSKSPEQIGFIDNDDVIAEINAIVQSGVGSSDFSFVIWIANQLGFGFEAIIDDIAKQLSALSMGQHSPSIDNLRLITARGSVVGSENSDREFMTINDVWEYARWLSNEHSESRARSVRKRLYREYERNRGIYIRVLALGVIFKVFSISELNSELSYVDSLYSPEGEFLWRENSEKTAAHSVNSGLVGTEAAIVILTRIAPPNISRKSKLTMSASPPRTAI